MSPHIPGPAASTRPDPATARLVLSSCRQLADREGELAASFVAHLNALNPGRSPQRQALGDAQAVELLHSILDAVRLGADEDLIERRWEEMGALAHRAGFAEDGFGQVGHALVRAVRELSGDDWSSALSSGWMAVHVWLATHLAAGAAAARAVGHPQDGYPQDGYPQDARYPREGLHPAGGDHPQNGYPRTGDPRGDGYPRRGTFPPQGNPGGGRDGAERDFDYGDLVNAMQLGSRRKPVPKPPRRAH